MKISQEIINKLKNNFKGNYNIPEVISYLNELTDIYNYKYKTLNTYVYYRFNKDTLNISRIQRIIKRSYKVITNINCNKIFTIHLILSPAKKQFNLNDYLTASNTNSGFTYTNGTEIFIFREEEFPKVILHELLHHQPLIHNNNFSNINKLALMKHFNLRSDTILILNETIIELWALLLHLSFISTEYNLNYNELFQLELKYSIYKSYQLLKLQKSYKNNIWFDKCNIFSYIIFKTIIMLSLKDFFKIYTYPYDNTKITNFIIQKSDLLFELTKNKLQLNPEFIFQKRKIQRPSNSLCFMLLSDL